MVLGTNVQNQKSWVMVRISGLPHIVDFNTAAINANSTATGMCF
ncbi:MULTISPECIES: hypothetical protein [Ralstonia]|uniref:Uncharacterized protein n=1 Tax=Ralstonia insidiosa TaxID=190721 RepID=A0AAC9BJX8_9RALS|nr:MULTISPECIES: hypothetical protein [Ralstonia]ANH75236.1 hypothetical protein ACS15_5733 [Ralstonia insidiosa]EPX99989.1 hypothetical protein C404_02160 [Ralstonia sp. AU12-08]